MTNEEKVINIINKHRSQFTDTETSSYCNGVEDGALEMAEWKDEEFKCFLSQLILKQQNNMKNQSHLTAALVQAMPMLGLDNLSNALEEMNDLWETYKEKGTILGDR